MANVPTKSRRGPHQSIAGSATLTLAFYALAYLFLPASLLTISGAKPDLCTCPMCRIDADGAHHCSCCDHGETCKCAMSVPDDGDVPPLIRDVALLTLSNRFDIALRPDRYTPPPHATRAAPDLPVATPPPKA